MSTPAQHEGAIGPALFDLGLLLHGDHVLATVVLAKAEGVEDRDAGNDTPASVLAPRSGLEVKKFSRTTGLT